ncbi:MAG: CueP family metal-binding protein [Candidatus Izemoplasma sp.]|nr:CueP family metal-binding protein [Candidatus Izemoplasma sp.]
MKKIGLLIGSFIVALTLSACSSTNDLESVGLADLTGKEILTGVADGLIEVKDFGLSVYDDELIVILDDSRTSVDMPEDEFYLSVAPYINNTHSCTYHSATGCRGELKQETFFVEFIDNEGNVIVSENMDTLSNGFIDLWLPRDVEGTLTITQGELSASKTISTTAGEPTCETTMQLS